MRKVIIIVRGGVAEMVSKPADIEVEIRDYDTEGCDPEQLEPDGSMIQEYRRIHEILELLKPVDGKSQD